MVDLGWNLVGGAVVVIAVIAAIVAAFIAIDAMKKLSSQAMTADSFQTSGCVSPTDSYLRCSVSSSLSIVMPTLGVRPANRVPVRRSL